MANQASVIPAAKAQVELRDVEKYTPGPNELLVKVESIGFSPIEAKTQRFATHPIPYPNILGSSLAGTVAAVGPSVTTFQVGDRVASIRPPHALGNPKYGAYQKYALASATSTSKLDAATPLHAASATILNTAAVVCALTIHLGLARPDMTGGENGSKGKKVLVYGGSSSSGGIAVRFLAHAGYTVITTSSPAHTSFVSSLGAAHVLDHRAPLESLIASLASHGPYDAIFDTIGTPAATAALVGYLETVSSAAAPVAYNTLIPPLPGTREIPAHVERKFAPYSFALEEEAHRELRDWLFGVYVPQGLKTGELVPTRQEVRDGGLASVQAALDDMAEDRVSGVKLVLDPWA